MNLKNINIDSWTFKLEPITFLSLVSWCRSSSSVTGPVGMMKHSGLVQQFVCMGTKIIALGLKMNESIKLPFLQFRHAVSDEANLPGLDWLANVGNDRHHKKKGRWKRLVQELRTWPPWLLHHATILDNFQRLDERNRPLADSWDLGCVRRPV